MCARDSTLYPKHEEHDRNNRSGSIVFGPDFLFIVDMTLLEKILNEALLCESVSEMEVSDAIDKHIRVIINYHSKGEDVATGARH